jgi:hypothetical protein
MIADNVVGEGWFPRVTDDAPHTIVILRSRALARRLERRPQALVADPSRLAAGGGEHLRMTVVTNASSV